MGALQSIGNYISSGMAKSTNLKPMKWISGKFAKDPEGVLGAATVTSIILKDGIGCGMYVTQSLNNDKIPEKKRKFVAALDLTNGVLMIGAQIAMFFAMRKYSGPLFKKLFKKSFNPKTESEIISKIRMEEMAKTGHTSKKQVIKRAFDKVESDAASLFKFVLDIAAATILGKRVIVPLVATPLAKKVEKKMEKHHGADATKPQDTNKPAEKNDVQPNEKVATTGKKLDIVSTGNSTNLLDKAKVGQNK